MMGQQLRIDRCLVTSAWKTRFPQTTSHGCTSSRRFTPDAYEGVIKVAIQPYWVEREIWLKVIQGQKVRFQGLPRQILPVHLRWPEFAP